MTSQDNAVYVTVEMFNDGVARIERRLDKVDQTLTEMRAEIREIDRRAEINTVKIDELHYFMGIGFAIIAIVVAFVGYMMSGSSSRKDMKQDILDTVRGEMQSMIDVAISRALSAKNQ